MKPEEMICVYVAGSITPRGPGHPVIEYLENKRRGVRATAELIMAGYAVFCPFTDDQYWMTLRDEEEITPGQIYLASMAMMERCDVVFVLPNSYHSRGTKAEIERAKELGIPVIYSLEALLMGYPPF